MPLQPRVIWRALEREIESEFDSQTSRFCLKLFEIIQRPESRIDRFVSEVISPKNFIDRLDPTVLAKAFRGNPASPNPDDKSAATTSPQRVRAKRAVARSWPKRAKTKEKRGRAK